jgi:hypothetical protein
MVLKTVTPLYSVLRFANQQKNGTISSFLPKMLSAQAKIFAKLKHDKNVKRDFMKKVNEIIKKKLSIFSMILSCLQVLYLLPIYTLMFAASIVYNF